MIIEWACAERALGDPAEGAESGDLHVIVSFHDGALVAVIDGLGHGTEAAVAARAAAKILETHAQEAPDLLVRRCHAELGRTRGVVMSLACFDSRTDSMTWTGVGNVDAVLVRTDRARCSPSEALALRGGVIGYQIPTVRPATVTVSPGDTLIMVTDGIRRDFTDGIDLRDGPRCIADSILSRHGKHSDDALALAVRYLGSKLAEQVGQARQSCEPHVQMPSLAGFEALHGIIPVREEVDVIVACRRTRDLAVRNGLSPGAAEALATATSELARNIILHATAGEILLGTLRESDRRGVAVMARDHGPGMQSVELALRDGYSSARGLGLGLSSARRLTDEFDLLTAPGQGTTVIVKKWAR
jgi:anti-sigma regulatory factor (Ser/Thr protein kinase)